MAVREPKVLGIASADVMLAIIPENIVLGIGLELVLLGGMFLPIVPAIESVVFVIAV